MHGQLVPEEVQPRQIGHARFVELRNSEQTRLVAQIGQIAALDREEHKCLDNVGEGGLGTGARRLEQLGEHAADEGDLCLDGGGYHGGSRAVAATIAGGCVGGKWLDLARRGCGHAGHSVDGSRRGDGVLELADGALAGLEAESPR